MAQAAALKAKHAIEAQEEDLRQKKEQLELDAKIAALNANIAVLQKADNSSKCSRNSRSKSIGINKADSLEFDSARPKCLNPDANKYVQVNSKPTNTVGVADLFVSQVITENQRKGWRNQQFHTAQQSDFRYSAQVQPS